MSFGSLGEFFAMGHHGAYVWSAYGLFAVVLAWNIASPWRARRRYLEQQARNARRERQA